MNALSSRLIAAFLFIILLVLAIVGGTLIFLLRDNPVIERVAVTRLNESARAAIEQEFLTPTQNVTTLRTRIVKIAADYGLRVLITDDEGDILFDSAATALPLNFQRFRNARRDPNLPQALIGRITDADRVSWLYVARPFGAQRKLVFSEQQARFPVLAYFNENLLLPLIQAGAIATGVALILAVLIANSIATPLQKMAGVAHRIAQGDYSQAAPVSGPDEVQDLSQSFNRMAQQVRATQQAQHDFLANISHDLKTPLTSIQGFAQAMLDGAADSPALVQRSAQIIYAESERMQRLVNSLLDLARLDAGLKTLHKQALALLPWFTALIEKFAPRAQEKGVQLHLDLPATLPPLTADPDRLTQVFTNLLDNALKHTPAGGHITLSAQAIAQAVEISVKDTGVGIPSEDLGRVFERFYQVDKARARSSGVGLGLAITKEIVEAHHGTVRVESAPGGGATFIVRLPTLKPDDTTLIRRRN